MKSRTRDAVPIDEIQPHPRNVREGDIGAISLSLEQHGQYLPVTVQESSGNILRGNHTWRAMKALGWDTCAAQYIDVDDDTALRIMLVDNRTSDLASNNEPELAELLIELAGTPLELLGTGFDGNDLDQLLTDLDLTSEYTGKVESPVYQPTGDRPDVSELYDESKTKTLLAAIDSAALPDDIARFLRVAAERHTEFRFDQIAEFYAHADKEIQMLMEESALIIIDFDQAIELGFVALTDAIAQQYRTENQL